MKTSIVKVIFNINQEYPNQRLREYFFAAYEEDLQEGDVVVVDTRNGFQLVTVTGTVDKFPDFIPNNEIKEVVCKVDFRKFNERAEKRQKAKELKKRMDERIKQLQAGAVYEMFAEKDPELKNMLEEFRSIDL